MTIRFLILFLGMGFVALEFVLSKFFRKHLHITRWALALYAAANILFMAYLWVNHINFPLNLDVMESTVLQHFERAAALQPIYPEPTPEYIPLAYNPLYYVLSIPFAWLFGVNLFTLRFVAILGTIGSGWILFSIVRERTSSVWWGLMAVGLFTASYRAMDAYLDTAHADSWLLFSALLGSYLIARNRSQSWNLIGVAVLVASFWFKQHGALFVIGGLLFLTLREGVRRSILFWVYACIFGPIFYFFAGPSLLGSQFIYFTWEIPRQWSVLNLDTFRHFFGWTIKSYPILALSSGLEVVRTFVKNLKGVSIWHFQSIFAVLSGFMGALDPGSAENVFIPMGTWFILIGILGLYTLVSQAQVAKKLNLHSVALVISFAILSYSPTSVIISPRADESNSDLIEHLNSLPGQVYAPMVGQLQEGFEFYPAAHWVALEDMIRGPGREIMGQPSTRRQLDSLITPNGQTYILHNFPLEIDPMLGFLSDHYVLDTDFEDRFEPLSVLPGRYTEYQAYPRYLYRFELEAISN